MGVVVRNIEALACSLCLWFVSSDAVIETIPLYDKIGHGGKSVEVVSSVTLVGLLLRS